MPKNILKILIPFAAGILGGVFADQIFLPHLIERPPASIYGLGQQPVYINQTKEVIIKENDALENAIETASKTIVAVRSLAKGGEILEGSGLILTSDGLMVTLNELIPMGSTFYFYVNGSPVSYQILKRDADRNLSIIKLGKNNLPTASFAIGDKIKLGEKVFLVGTILKDGVETAAAVNEGIVRAIGQDYIQTTIFDNEGAKGSVLFNIEGNVLGINTLDENKRIISIPVETIRQISGL